MSDIWHMWLLELYNRSLWLAVTEPHLSCGKVFDLHLVVLGLALPRKPLPPKTTVPSRR